MTHASDFCGLDVTLPPGPAVAAWDATVRGFLAHAAVTPESLAETLELAPDFALGHAARGLFCLLLARAEMIGTARTALADARDAGRRAAPTPREAAYLDALSDWLDGRPGGAVARLEAVLEAHPRDALAMKLVQAIQFMRGRPVEMRRSAEKLLPAWREAHPALGYLHGCHAFTLEETGAYSAAEAAGHAALVLAPDDAWGLHAVAHVFDMTGRAGAGLDWLEGRDAAWAHCNNFRFHVWWHKALMHLDLGQHAEALALYDREIRAERTDDFRDISNAASLLCRLEIEGIGVGTRWEELADLAERRTGDGCLAFADLHYLLALIGGDRGAAARRLISRIARDGARGGSETDAVMNHPGLAAAQGLAAFTAGDHATACARLMRARAAMIDVGGSHAQRDVFARLTVEAAIRAGRLDTALDLIEERRRFRGAEDGYSARRRGLIAELRDAGQPPGAAA